MLCPTSEIIGTTIIELDVLVNSYSVKNKLCSFIPKMKLSQNDFIFTLNYSDKKCFSYTSTFYFPLLL